jgi:hypothetical protein
MSLQEMLAATLECPVCLEVPKTGKKLFLLLWKPLNVIILKQR